MEEGAGAYRAGRWTLVERKGVPGGCPGVASCGETRGLVDLRGGREAAPASSGLHPEGLPCLHLAGSSVQVQVPDPCPSAAHPLPREGLDALLLGTWPSLETREQGRTGKLKTTIPCSLPIPCLRIQGPRAASQGKKITQGTFPRRHCPG